MITNIFDWKVGFLYLVKLTTGLWWIKDTEGFKMTKIKKYIQSFIWYQAFFVYSKYIQILKTSKFTNLKTFFPGFSQIRSIRLVFGRNRTGTGSEKSGRIYPNRDRISSRTLCRILVESQHSNFQIDWPCWTWFSSRLKMAVYIITHYSVGDRTVVICIQIRLSRLKLAPSMFAFYLL